MLRCFYDPGYFLPLPAGHPFPMEKFPEARALLGDAVRVEPPLALTGEDLERAHRRDYLDRVGRDAEDGRGGLSRYERNRLGLPADERLLARSSLEAGGTVSASLAALETGVAANLAGGTHHAFPGRGLGFCVLNDVAIAVENLRARGLDLSILIVDTDAHQGNANHAYFRDDALVFTFSIHVGRNYPARKEPGDLDLPLDRYVGDETYLRGLELGLRAAFGRTEPDLVFWISGADSHRDDRFGQMGLSWEGMAARDARVMQYCEAFDCPTVVLYGGGYNRVAGTTARLHAQSVRIAAQSLGRIAPHS